MKRMACLTLFFLFCVLEIMAKSLLIDKIPLSEKIVALTIENTRTEGSLTELVKLCRQEKVRFTLFCCGQAMKVQENSIRELISLGCEVGISGVKYQPWEELRGEEIWREYELAKAMLPKAALKKTFLVRPPYDNYHENVLSALNGRDEILVVRGTSKASDIGGGSIINVKIGDKSSLKDLEDTITYLKRQGYQIEPVLVLMKKWVDNKPQNSYTR